MSKPPSSAYRVVFFDEDRYTEFRYEYFTVLHRAIHALGYEEGFQAGDSWPHMDEMWLERYDETLEQWKKVELDLD